MNINNLRKTGLCFIKTGENGSSGEIRRARNKMFRTVNKHGSDYAV